MLTIFQRLLTMLLAVIAIVGAVTPNISFAGPGCGSATTVANEDEEDEGDDGGDDEGDEEEERA